MTRHLSKLAIAAALAGVLASLLLPGSTVSYTAPDVAEAATVEVTHEPNYTIPPAEDLAVVIGPHESMPQPHELLRASVSGYTSSVDETDDTPNVNASGGRPGPGSIACPSRFKFGTKVLIAGDEYTCDDRMAPRYAAGDYFDIWFASKSAAIHWGRRTVTVNVVQ